MFRRLLRCGIAALALLPGTAIAGQITLKLAVFGSDRSNTYEKGIKPFLEAVNSEAKGLMEIVLYSGGVLGREIPKQPQLVSDGVADIAYVVPGYSPERFPDNTLFELPSLFRDAREGTLVATRMIAANALKGYEDFVVIGAYGSEPQSIHSRQPINSLADLSGMRIRVNNVAQATALRKLGAIPVTIELTRVSDAISSGAVDAAAMARAPLSDYGIKRVAHYSYFLGTGGSSLALIMSRKRFEQLPKAAQDIILKYSGEWPAARFIEFTQIDDRQIMQQLKSEPQRHVVFPSQPDLDRAQAAFASVVEQWAEESPHNRDLVNRAEAEIAKLRSTGEAADGPIR